MRLAHDVNVDFVTVSLWVDVALPALSVTETVKVPSPSPLTLMPVTLCVVPEIVPVPVTAVPPAELVML